MNWKFWTWPRQIRRLETKLKTAGEIIERQRKDLEAVKPPLVHPAVAEQERHRRGLHRAHM